MKLSLLKHHHTNWIVSQLSETIKPDIAAYINYIMI